MLRLATLLAVLAAPGVPSTPRRASEESNQTYIVASATFALHFCLPADNGSIRGAVSASAPSLCSDSAGALVHTQPETQLPSSLCPTGWAFDDATPCAGGTACTVSTLQFNYTCGEPPTLTATSWWSADAGTAGPVRHGVSICNGGVAPVRFSPGPTLALDAAQPTDTTTTATLSHWHVQKEAGGNAPHGPTAAAVTPGYNRTLLSGPYSSDAPDNTRDDIMWLCLEGTNSTIYGGIEFSGWSTISVSRPVGSPHGASITMGLPTSLPSNSGRGGQSSSISVAHPGLVFTYPTVFIGVASGDVEDSTNELHRFVEAKLRPPVPGGVTPLIVHNSWCLASFLCRFFSALPEPLALPALLLLGLPRSAEIRWIGMSVDKAKVEAMTEVAIEVGMEMVHVDAGKRLPVCLPVWLAWPGWLLASWIMHSTTYE